MAQTGPSVFSSFENFLEEYKKPHKSAQVNKAAEDVGPGDDTSPVREGSQTADNDAKLKELIPGTVASGPLPEIDAVSQLPQDGIPKGPTGTGELSKDLASTTTDPGTSSQAKVTSEKYATMSFDDLARLQEEQINDNLAKITARQLQSQRKAAGGAPAAAAPAATAPAAAGADDEAHKRAFLESVQAGLTNVIADAIMDADEVWTALSLEKRAEEEESASEEKKEPAKEESGKGPPPASDASSAPAGAPPAADAATSGGDMGGGGGDAGGGMNEEAALNEFLNALREEGLTIEDMLAILPMLTGGGGAGAAPAGDPAAMGGAPPMGDPMAAMGGGAGAPPMGDPMAAMGGAPPMADKMAKQAAAEYVEQWRALLIKAARHRNSYQYVQTEAKTAQQRQFRNQIVSTLRELTRGRRTA